MSSTIQWCDGPRPSVKRPSHTAWFDSACCAIATGCRVWMGITAVPSSTRVVARPISAIAVRASKSFGIWGTQIDAKPACLGRVGVRDRASRPCRGSGPSRGRSSGRSAPASSFRRAAVAADPNGVAGPSGNAILVFRESACAQFGYGPYSTGRRVRKGDAMSRVAVITGAASGMGLAVGAAPRGGRQQGRAARPRRRRRRQRCRRALDESGAAGDRDRGRRQRSGRRRRARWRRCAAELGPIEIIVTSAGFDEFESFTDITPEAWDADDRGQPHRHVPLHPVGDPRHDRRGLGPDRDDLVVERAVGCRRAWRTTSRRRAAWSGSPRRWRSSTRRDGITVNTIPPGFIDTPMARRAEARGDLPTIDAVATRTPVRRAGTPEDIAAACAFLCSDDAGLHHGSADRRQRRLVPVSESRAPRLAPIPPDEWSDDARAALGRRSPTTSRRGCCRPSPTRMPMPNALATMMHHPTLAGPVPRLQQRARCNARARAAPA